MTFPRFHNRGDTGSRMRFRVHLQHDQTMLTGNAAQEPLAVAPTPVSALSGEIEAEMRKKPRGKTHSWETPNRR
jgi:hypothetical protein